MGPERKYWNALIETLPTEKLRDLQFMKFKRTLEWAYQNSPFYQKIYKKQGLEPGDIKNFNDMRLIPKVDKSMMKYTQKKEPFPYGDILSVSLDEVSAFRQTSGTTGTPVYHAETWQDLDWYAETWAYVLYSQGYRKTDRVFIPFGYNIFVAFWGGHFAAEKIGCEVVPGGVLDTKARILKMQELKCTALMATPTYVLGMADTAKNALGIDVSKELNIKRITCAGEPGASVSSTKKRMEDAWGATVYDHIGSTESGAWGYECMEQPGGLHVNEAFFLVEIEDINTGEPIHEAGKPGKMIITAFDRMAKPCIRFDSNDVIKWAEHSCNCGRTFRLIDGGIIGRADDITKVKGVLLAPTAIEDVVRGFPQLADEYEVVVKKKGDMDDILLKIELSPGHEQQSDTIISSLKDQLRLKTNLGYRIEVLPFGSLPRYELKSKRFKDLRKRG